MKIPFKPGQIVRRLDHKSLYLVLKCDHNPEANWTERWTLITLSPEGIKEKWYAIISHWKVAEEYGHS